MFLHFSRLLAALSWFAGACSMTTEKERKQKMILKREFEDLFGTHGVLLFDDETPTGVFTLEEPWKDNQREISCIPTGTYKLKEHDGTHFKDVWEVCNVPNRTAILIHAGNTIKDTRGCILVGLFRRKDGVGSSQDALAWLRLHMPSNASLQVRGIPKSEDKIS